MNVGWGGGFRFGTLKGTFFLQQNAQGRSPGREDFLGLEHCVQSSLSLLCSLNWPCRSNSPRRWQPASCPARSPLRPLPSVLCQGPLPSGLPLQQPPPSSLLPSWAQLCFAPQQEPSALPQDPSSLPPISPPGEDRADFLAVTLPTLLSLRCLSSYIPQGTAFYSLGVPEQSRESWASLQGRCPSLHLDWGSTNIPLAQGPCPLSFPRPSRASSRLPCISWPDLWGANRNPKYLCKILAQTHGALIFPTQDLCLHGQGP